MKVKKVGLKASGILVMVGIIFFLCQGVGSSETCQIVKIGLDQAGQAEKITISPEKITVSPDTCVVWINWVRVQKVKVSFQDNAKQCNFKDSTGFKLAEGEECYFTDYLERGKTASMYIQKPGVYKYTLELEGNPNATKHGEIEVK